MFRAVVLFCAVLALTEGGNWNWNTTQVSQCHLNGAGPLPINAYIAGCTTQPCRLEQGRDAVIEIVFRAPYDIHQLRTMAFVYISIFAVPYDLRERANTCNFLSNTNCPVEEGEVVKSTLTIPIEDIPVGTMVAIEIRIQDEEKSYNIICFRWVLDVVAPGSG